MGLIWDTQHNNIECHYAECHDFLIVIECRYAECRYAECRYAECRGRPKFDSLHSIFSSIICDIQALKVNANLAQNW